MNRPLKYHQRGGLLALHGERNGQHPPAIADQRRNAKLIAVRRHPTEPGVLAVVEDNAGQVRVIRAITSDDHQLSVLTASARAEVASAIHAAHAASKAPPEDSTDAEGWQ